MEVRSNRLLWVLSIDSIHDALEWVLWVQICMQKNRKHTSSSCTLLFQYVTAGAEQGGWTVNSHMISMSLAAMTSRHFSSAVSTPSWALGMALERVECGGMRRDEGNEWASHYPNPPSDKPHGGSPALANVRDNWWAKLAWMQTGNQLKQVSSEAIPWVIAWLPIDPNLS